MGAFYETIPESIIQWILEQKLFWVATAPLSAKGHVNVSPKGGQYFGVIDEKTFWYLDLTGSGNETLAHLHEPGNGRITIMFNAFEGGPKIVRLWGQGRVLENSTKEFDAFTERHNVETIPGSRSIIIVDIHQVGSSCGFSVPFYDFKSFRPTLNEYFARKAKKFEEGKQEEDIERQVSSYSTMTFGAIMLTLYPCRYWAFKNAWSMDGLPGMQRAGWAAKQYSVAPIKKMVGPLAPTKYYAGYGFSLLQMLFLVLIAFLLGTLAAVHAPDITAKISQDLRENHFEMNLVNFTHGGNRIISRLWSTK